MYSFDTVKFRLTKSVIVAITLVAGSPLCGAATTVAAEPSSQLSLPSQSATTAPTNNVTAPLPNAYELLKRLDSQQKEMARLANQVETLQIQITDLQKTIAKQGLNQQGEPSTDQQALKDELSTALTTTLTQTIKEQIAQQIKIEMAALEERSAKRRPYLLPPVSTNSNDAIGANAPILLTNNDIPKASRSSTASSNPISENRQGELAYAAAYSALKNEGVAAGIQKMQTFIATYARHDLIPNAHYWLGEFYLKESPPNVAMAKEEFLKVISKFRNHPKNSKQSKALYRLATFAKANGKHAAANQYAAELIRDYPNSAEAKLARSVNW